MDHASTLMPMEPRASGKVSRRWPSNAVRYFRNRRGLSLEEVAAAINANYGERTNHQTIQRLETGKMKLTPEWAEKIGAILHVPYELLGFSDESDAYPWAARAVPVVGSIDSQMQVHFSECQIRRIGAPNVTRTTRALELLEGAVAEFAGWSIMYDDAFHQRMSQRILHRQTEEDAKFIVHLKDDTTWWRRIVPSTRAGHYHLEAQNKRPIYDVEIAWVSEMIRSPLRPSQDLPPIA